MALEHHPDKGGDKDAFIAINAAYETLSDEGRRAEYDDERSGRGRPRFGHGGGGFHHGRCSSLSLMAHRNHDTNWSYQPARAVGFVACSVPVT
jgi:curved DNA-binding protein CbpA